MGAPRKVPSSSVGENPNEKYLAVFLCPATTQESQHASRERGSVQPPEFTPAIPGGRQTTLPPQCRGNSEDQENPVSCSESFQASEAGGGRGSCPCSVVFSSPQTFPPILAPWKRSAGWRHCPVSCKRAPVEFVCCFSPSRGYIVLLLLKFSGLRGLEYRGGVFIILMISRPCAS